MGLFKVLRFLVWIVFGLGIHVYTKLTGEDDRFLIFKEPVSNKALEGYEIRTVKVSDEGSCRVECYLEPDCVSINVGPSEDGGHVCELNKATDESTSLSALIERQRYTYYGVENPCHSSSCPSKYEVCQVGFTDKRFRCACREKYKNIYEKDPVTGIDSLSGSRYFLFTTPETWNNVRARCKCLGAQLLKIESAEDNDFVKKTFLTAAEVTYWIGLSDQMEEGKWIWTDGSLLENYANWKSNPNNKGGNQNCGHITKGSFWLKDKYYFNNFDGEWNDLECHFTLGYICEEM